MDREPDSHASVIILTRNGMPLVEQCLRAVLAQDAPWPYQVIVIDAYSTDGTWERVQSLPVRARTYSTIGTGREPWTNWNKHCARLQSRQAYAYFSVRIGRITP